MVKVCRSMATDFRTIVLGRAMSAATLLCLGSEELIMGATASLGPIDPQMVTTGARGQRLVPAHVIIETFRQMIAASQDAILAKRPPDPFFRVLDSLDTTAVFESIKAVESTKTIAKELLASGLLKASPEKIDAAVNALMAEGEKEFHGKHLYPEAVTNQIGLPVTVLKVGDALDLKLRELFVRIEIYANTKGVAKYIVTREGGIDVNIQARPVG